MNPTAILSLISDLYGQIAALGEENTQLRKALEDASPQKTVSEEDVREAFLKG